MSVLPECCHSWGSGHAGTCSGLGELTMGQYWYDLHAHQQCLICCTASFSVMDYIGEKAKAVNSAMSVYVPETLGPHPKIIFDAMRHSLLAGGKRCGHSAVDQK